MNGYNFTDRVRRALQLAREEAARLHHEYVGTEHILLGLIREGEGVGVAVLTNLNVDLEEICGRIDETGKRGKAAARAGPDLCNTARTVHARRAGKPPTRLTRGVRHEGGRIGTGTPAARGAARHAHRPGGVGERDLSRPSERRRSDTRTRARSDCARRSRVD